MEMGRGELGRWGIGVVARWGREEVRSMREGWGARDLGWERWCGRWGEGGRARG